MKFTFTSQVCQIAYMALSGSSNASIANMLQMHPTRVLQVRQKLAEALMRGMREEGSDSLAKLIAATDAFTEGRSPVTFEALVHAAKAVCLEHEAARLSKICDEV